MSTRDAFARLKLWERESNAALDRGEPRPTENERRRLYAAWLGIMLKGAR